MESGKGYDRKPFLVKLSFHLPRGCEVFECAFPYMQLVFFVESDFSIGQVEPIFNILDLRPFLPYSCAKESFEQIPVPLYMLTKYTLENQHRTQEWRFGR